MTMLLAPQTATFSPVRKTLIESDWPVEEPGYDDLPHAGEPADGDDDEFDSELFDPLDDCLFAADDCEEAFPEPGDFWTDDLDDEPW
ncbi:MAG: hypothetical protein KDA44_10080 [Planctomycetales bacterium]|nr:hypothetical protein [Planctomycetales bacterium]